MRIILVVFLVLISDAVAPVDKNIIFLCYFYYYDIKLIGNKNLNTLP